MKKTFASILTLGLIAATFAPALLASPWPSWGLNRYAWEQVCPDGWTRTACFSGQESCTPTDCAGEIKK